MKVKILGDWTYRKGEEVYTCNSPAFDMDDDQAERLQKRLMVEIIPTKDKKDAKAKSS